ncbi:MAG: response regulator [bacterium]
MSEGERRNVLMVSNSLGGGGAERQLALQGASLHGPWLATVFSFGGGVYAMLDLTMPRMDGQEVFLAIQAADPQMPVVIFSGFPAEDIALRFPEPRPAAFLQKPFSLEGLKLVLGPLLGPRPADGSSSG